MDRLPDALLRSVFRCLSVFRVAVHCRAVCRTWNRTRAPWRSAEVPFFSESKAALLARNCDGKLAELSLTSATCSLDCLQCYPLRALRLEDCPADLATIARLAILESLQSATAAPLLQKAGRCLRTCHA